MERIGRWVRDLRSKNDTISSIENHSSHEGPSKSQLDQEKKINILINTMITQMLQLSGKDFKVAMIKISLSN